MSQTQLYERMLEDIQSVAMTLEDDQVLTLFEEFKTVLIRMGLLDPYEKS